MPSKTVSPGHNDVGIAGNRRLEHHVIVWIASNSDALSWFDDGTHRGDEIRDFAPTGGAPAAISPNSAMS